jgi:Holliday junction resolvasome RuvABC endonuclease subunit
VRFRTPSEVKAAVTGNGGAGKAQVTAMVTKILGLQAKPTPADAADFMPADQVSANQYLRHTRHHAHGMAMLLFTHRDDASSVSWCYADNGGDR